MTRLEEELAFSAVNHPDTQHDTHVIGLAILALVEEQKRAADALEVISNQRHLEILEEIRDLARTGLPIQDYEQGQWDRHRLARIADMANTAIKRAGNIQKPNRSKP